MRPARLYAPGFALSCEPGGSEPRGVPKFAPTALRAYKTRSRRERAVNRTEGLASAEVRNPVDLSTGDTPKIAIDASGVVDSGRSAGVERRRRWVAPGASLFALSGAGSHGRLALEGAAFGQAVRPAPA